MPHLLWSQVHFPSLLQAAMGTWHPLCHIPQLSWHQVPGEQSTSVSQGCVGSGSVVSLWLAFSYMLSATWARKWGNAYASYLRRWSGPPTHYGTGVLQRSGEVSLRQMVLFGKRFTWRPEGWREGTVFKMEQELLKEDTLRARALLSCPAGLVPEKEIHWAWHCLKSYGIEGEPGESCRTRKVMTQCLHFSSEKWEDFDTLPTGRPVVWFAFLPPLPTWRGGVHHPLKESSIA